MTLAFANISLSTLWWVLAGVAIAAELATGTFYLLMVALGLVAGAIAAHLGLTIPLQITIAAIAGGGATALWHLKHRQQPSADTASNKDVNLDVGERIHIKQWSTEGTTRISYRGSIWSARIQSGYTAAPGEHVIAAVEANCLILVPISASSSASLSSSS